MTIRTLTPIEARVLGTLMEKARTVPDSYPLSLNALVAGCNQKTSREPLMQIGEAEALQALDTLRGSTLIFENHGARTARYEHNFQRAAGVTEPAAVLLGLLMLRGPQTAGELRLNAERWYRFADIATVEEALATLLADGEERGQPMLCRLNRAPGAREQRWAHLLCGPVEQQDFSAGPSDGASATPASGELQALKDRVNALEGGLAALCAQLGVELATVMPGTPPENK
jgi:uncharacterized protein YceH (UPF0502 family)